MVTDLVILSVLLVVAAGVIGYLLERSREQQSTPGRPGRATAAERGHPAADPEAELTSLSRGQDESPGATSSGATG